MAGRLVSIIVAGIAGTLAISLVIPVLLISGLARPAPGDVLFSTAAVVERSWLMIAAPAILFLTGALATHLARAHLKGLTDCFLISVPASAIALLSGIAIYYLHRELFDPLFSGTSDGSGMLLLLLAAFFVALLLEAVAGAFAYYYFFYIRPATHRSRA